MPSVKPIHKRALRFFVRTLLRSRNKSGELHFSPLPADTDLTVDGWLSLTHYSQARRLELKAHDDGLPLRSVHYKCNSFIKTEVLADFKMPRIINSRSDKFKVATGPIFKRIEERVFQSDYFIKHIPVQNRMDFLVKRLSLPGRRYVATDYSSFEAHMTPEILNICEFQLYSYMTKNLPKKPRLDFLSHVRKALAGRSTGVSKLGGFSIPGVRMSGDMCTSLGNGFTNLCLSFYLLTLYGFKPDGVFEGDDGLLAVQSASGMLTKKEFESIGAIIKMEPSATVEEAGFCGLYAARGSFDNLCDVVDVLVKFGWTMSNAKAGGEKVIRQLLRAKAFSLAFEMPRCPILRELANYALRITADVAPKFEVNKYGELGWWDEQVLRGAVLTNLPADGVSNASRQFVHEKWGISPQVQVDYEQYLKSKNDLLPIPLSLEVRDSNGTVRVSSIEVPECNTIMWNRYVTDVPQGTKDLVAQMC